MDTSKAIRYQPYPASDGDYEPSLAFVRARAPRLASGREMRSFRVSLRDMR